MINRLLRQATVRPDNIRSMEDRFTIYSGHDNTLSPLLLALGLQLDHWPPFASRYSSYYYIITRHQVSYSPMPRLHIGWSWWLPLSNPSFVFWAEGCREAAWYGVWALKNVDCTWWQQIGSGPSMDLWSTPYVTQTPHTHQAKPMSVF